MITKRITTIGRKPAPRSIFVRRTWHADDPAQAAGTTGAAGTSSAGTENAGGNEPPKTVPYERFAEVNAKFREYEAAAQKLAAEKQKRDEADALARGEHEKVIADLRPRADRAEALQKSLEDYLAAELANVPDNIKFLFEGGDVVERLEKIKTAKANGVIGRPAAPATDAGAQGGATVGAKPTAQHQAAADIAAQMGFKVDPQKLAEREKEITQRKRQPKQDEDK